MSKQIAIPIPLSVWQDPQGDVVLLHSRDRCTVSFACWETNGAPANYLCRLTFNHAWAVRAVCSEIDPYEYREHLRSCIYEIQESEWLKRLSEERVALYPRWLEWDHKSYHHFLISGHDNYCEIIAEGFEEEIISRESAGELLDLIGEA